MIVRGGSTVVEHLFQHPEVKGLSPAAGTGEEGQKNALRWVVFNDLSGATTYFRLFFNY
jgi:hypothetical protein